MRPLRRRRIRGVGQPFFGRLRLTRCLRRPGWHRWRERLCRRWRHPRRQRGGPKSFARHPTHQRDDGYAAEDAYPKGPARPANGVQRGSVADMTQYPGDPLTPGIGATALAERLPISDAPTILKIPVLPISYGDAQHFLAALGGRVAPANWRGALPITYHVGGDGALVHMAVKSDWPLKTIYNVVAVMKGSTYPDQWIMRGNHHDGWVFGAADPMSGHIAMMGEAKAIGALAKTGWRPKRTLVYLSWDAEEPMLLGSTEWVETHAAELKEKGLVYVNSDGSGRAFSTWRAAIPCSTSSTASRPM